MSGPLWMIAMIAAFEVLIVLHPPLPGVVLCVAVFLIAPIKVVAWLRAAR